MGFVFFSLSGLPNGTPEEHKEYNRWYQLDHRAENVALPGVEFGDRWMRPAEYRRVSTAHDEFDVDYVTMYWFNEPFDASYQAWNDLGERSFQWGRGPLIPGVKRRMVAFFRAVKGYAAPSALVEPPILKFRPNQGIHFHLTRSSEHHSLDTHARYAWQDRVLMPQLMDVEGVAGGYTFSFSHHQQHNQMTFAEASDDPASSMRVRLLYLDGDPLKTTQRIIDLESELAAGDDANPAPDGEEILLSTPLRTILPFQDW